jgi:hypothetical protein
MEELKMKRKLVALGMAAVMVVGGAVMAFANPMAGDEDSRAEIEFVLNLPPVIEPPDLDPDPETDLPPDVPPGPHPGLTGLRAMDLDFGTRRLVDLDIEDNTFNTYDGGAAGFGDALAPGGEPDENLRVMGVAFQNEHPFRITVQRDNFTNDVLQGVNFYLVRYGTPTVTVGDIDNLTLIGDDRLVGIGHDGQIEVASSSFWGRYVLGFSGRLYNVPLSQVPTATKSQTTLTWIMVPPL